MDFLSKPLNIITTPNKCFKEIPGTSTMFKKRKLSSDSEDSLSNEDRPRKDSLNEDFNGLSLNKETKNTPIFNIGTQLSATSHIIGEGHIINIPKPVKVCRPRELSPKAEKANNSGGKDSFLENLIKIGSNDVEGISKYLDLNLNDKLFKWNQMNNKNFEKLDQNPQALLNSFINSPLVMPLINLTTPFTSNETMPVKGLSEYARYPYTTNFIGPLTKEQRIEKITKYLEKKKNRKWKHIRYNIRKDLADKRERIQGRFVKTCKSTAYASESSLDTKRCTSTDSQDSWDSLVTMRNKADRINLLDDTIVTNNSNNNIGLAHISVKNENFSD